MKELPFIHTSRRRWLRSALLGGAAFGLRSTLSGLPVAWLSDPARALAQRCPEPQESQFLVLSASEAGDPINANVPGTYGDPRVFHASDPRMVRTSFRLGSVTTEAAKPWADLAESTRARTSFFHHATLTNSHPNHAKVMALMGNTRVDEMVPSIYARHLAGCLGTVQREPVVLGAASSGELLKFEGRTIARLSPRGLRRLLAAGSGALADLRALRDRDLDRLNALFKEHGTSEQRKFLDRIALSQREARAIPEALLDNLSSIVSDDAQGQVLAAATLVAMRVSPVVSIHIPFGGDNHADPALARESDETVAGGALIDVLLGQLAALGMGDATTFALMNVFGRTLISNGAASAENGRTHNPGHAVSVLIGRKVRAGVVGGIVSSGRDVAAQSIDSVTGVADPAGDIDRYASMGALAKTLGVCLGIPENKLEPDILSGRVVQGAVA